jgi:predicted porin
MKKSLLAVAAIGAFASAAQAQSSVTVYGIYDGGFNTTKTEETTSANVVRQSQTGGYSGGESASSRIGFRGVEVINGDLSATFNLEYGFTAGTGTLVVATGTTGSTQGSESTVRTGIVGLTSKQFGSLNIGRQTTGIHDVVAGNVFGGNNMVGDITYTNFNSTTAGAGITASGRVSTVATRANNMVTYITPTFMGANLRADYSNDTNTASGQPGVQVGIKGITGSYTWGPIVAKASSTKVASNEALASTAVYSGTQTTINAANISYSGVKDLFVQYTYAINKTETQAGVLSSRVRAQKLSAKYQMGAFMPFVQYGIGGTQGTMVSTAANTTTDDKAYQAGVEYGLSKRSTLYAVYGYQDRKLINSTAESKTTEASIGMRHTF